MSQPLFGIYGAAGCGRGIMPIARRQLAAEGIDTVRLVFVDDAPERDLVNGHRVLRYEEFLAFEAEARFVAIAIADSQVRERLATRCASDGISSWSVRCETSIVMDEVIIGPGALLSPYVTITSNVRIGKFFHANLYSYVEHDCSLGNFVTFAPAVKCNGNVVIADHAYVGAGAILRQGKDGAPLRIGRGAIVGMGAVVTRDVADGEIVVGNPARPISDDAYRGRSPSSAP